MLTLGKDALFLGFRHSASHCFWTLAGCGRSEACPRPVLHLVLSSPEGGPGAWPVGPRLQGVMSVGVSECLCPESLSSAGTAERITRRMRCSLALPLWCVILNFLSMLSRESLHLMFPAEAQHGESKQKRPSLLCLPTPESPPRLRPQLDRSGPGTPCLGLSSAVSAAFVPLADRASSPAVAFCQSLDVTRGFSR